SRLHLLRTVLRDREPRDIGLRGIGPRGTAPHGTVPHGTATHEIGPPGMTPHGIGPQLRALEIRTVHGAALLVRGSRAAGTRQLQFHKALQTFALGTYRVAPFGWGLGCAWLHPCIELFRKRHVLWNRNTRAKCRRKQR